MKYTIYQLPDEHPLLFLNYSYALDHGGVNVSDYEKIYSGEISGKSPEDVLEKLYVIFNVQHPADYTGRSLSKSDLIKLEGIGTFFCDSFGWKKI